MINTREVGCETGRKLVVDVCSTDPKLLRGGEDHRFLASIEVSVTAADMTIEVKHPSRDGIGQKPAVFCGPHEMRADLTERAINSSGAKLIDGQEARDQIDAFLNEHLGALRRAPQPQLLK